MSRKRKQRVAIVEKKLGRERIHGQVWDYQDDNPLIEIDPRLKGKDRLTILTHEAVHIAFPALSEQKVIKAAKLIASVLWADDYRRIDQ